MKRYFLSYFGLTGLLCFAAVACSGGGGAPVPPTAVVSEATADVGGELVAETAVPRELGPPLVLGGTPVDDEVVRTPVATEAVDAGVTLVLPTKDGNALLAQLQASGVDLVRGTATPTAVSPTLSPNNDGSVTTDDPTLELAGSGFAELVQNDPHYAFVKIGFHVGINGDVGDLSLWMATLDAQGIPFFLKSVDIAGPLLEAQQLRLASGVPHVLVYRRSGGKFELPDYDETAVDAAREHWELHRDAFPPELDPSIVWLETVNEVDKNRSDWLGLFALETARLAVADGYRWAAFGWSAGEPEVRHWVEPNMVRFLQFAAENREQVAIALHEYSYEEDDLWREYPHLVGRFQRLYWVCDQLGLPRPTVLITEFGWEYRDVPEPSRALAHLRQAAKLYGSYPEVKGAAIWYLGGGYGSIDLQTKALIEPLLVYSQGHYFEHALQKEINPRIFR